MAVNKTDIALIGFGGNAKVIIDICVDNGYNIIGFFDDNNNVSIDPLYNDIPYLGTITDLVSNSFVVSNIVITIGNIEFREKIYNMLYKHNYLFPNIIHKKAYLSPTTKIGIGNVIYNNAIINSSTTIGNFNLINTSSIVEHDCVIGDFNNINPNVTICGTCFIGNKNLIGASSTIRNNITVGNNNLIGCASNVVKNIENNFKGYGNPIKFICNN